MLVSSPGRGVTGGSCCSHPRQLTHLSPIYQQLVLGPDTLAKAGKQTENRVAPGGGPSPRGADLAADPSDYAVNRDGTIEVQATETLGHYADWLDLKTSQLRSINSNRGSRSLAIGTRLQLDFSHVSVEQFQKRRLQHHRDLQEDFFDRNEIDGTRSHVTRSGESLWQLANSRYHVPLWLLRQYNPDLGLRTLHAGTRIVIPIVKTRGTS